MCNPDANEVSEGKYLGVIINCNLKVSDQCTATK